MQVKSILEVRKREEGRQEGTNEEDAWYNSGKNIEGGFKGK